jgi:hypothetical protein
MKTAIGRSVFVLNEIAAHAAGALRYDPRVDTIFEIGGQDAKYIRLAGGRVVDCAMNEACSAGTGSFIEEQGRKFVEMLYQQGGWAAVNKAYDNLPASTEQMLHPDKYLAGEKPIEVASVPLTGVIGGDWQLIADETLGEWRTYLLLSAGVDEAARLSEETAQQAAAGWGGDLVHLRPRPGRRSL